MVTTVGTAVGVSTHVVLVSVVVVDVEVAGTKLLAWMMHMCLVVMFLLAWLTVVIWQKPLQGLKLMRILGWMWC